MRVTLGEYVLKSDVEPLPGRTYGASLIKVHPYFKFTPQADRYDVAVIRLVMLMIDGSLQLIMFLQT